MYFPLPYIESVHWTLVAAASALQLIYPLRIGQIHPFLQIAICSVLVAVGVSVTLAYFLSTGSLSVVIGGLFVSTICIVLPSMGAVAGLGIATGLIASILAGNFVPGYVTPLTITGSLAGLASLFLYPGLIYHWQLVAPPIVGGWLASLCLPAGLHQYRYPVWFGLTVVSLFLHIRRRRVSDWLEDKRNSVLAVKETQIAQVMRLSGPQMSPEEFESVKEKLLNICEGDQEQVDRIVFGQGMY